MPRTLPPAAAAGASLVLVSLAWACGAGAPEVEGGEGLSGEQLFGVQRCGVCHGETGEGRSLGPPLRDLDAHWTVESLAAYLADPASVIADNERLQDLDQRYGTDMKPFPNMSLDERERLATWVLTLE